MEKIEIILTNCIQDIRSGRYTLGQCLDRYPARRQELEPLLKMALYIQKPADFRLDPDYKQSAKAQLLQQIRTTKPKKERSISALFSFGLPSQMVWARIAIAVAIGVIVISMLGGGTAYASQSSLPGEILYPVKTGTEDVRLRMAGNNTEKADLNLEFARTRLTEMSKLANRNSDKVGLAVNGYRNNLQAAVNNIQEITDASILTNTLRMFSLRLEDQISFSDQIIDAGPADSESVQEAGNIAVTQQINILKRLAREDNLQAAQTNLNMMQNRLQRAEARADEHQYQTMQETMLQYQRFSQLGLEILQNAQTTQNQADEIDKLSSAALQSYLGTLAILYQQVPQEYKNVLQNSQELTLQFQTQARYGYQNQSGPGQGSSPAPSGDGSGPTKEPGPPVTSQPQGDTGNTGTGTPAPTPGTGSNTGSGNGSETGGGTGSGSGSSNGSNSTTAPGTGGNTGSGSGTGSGEGPGTGKTPASTGGNS